MIDNAALNTLLDSFFRNQAPPGNWYLGIIDAASFTALAIGDTMASHVGWIELTAYDGATRPLWASVAASGQLIVAPTVLLTANAVKTWRGLFLASDSTKGGTSGILWATGLFDSTAALNPGEDITLSYELTAQGRDA